MYLCTLTCKITFLGFQENLYPHGLSLDSGATSPPVKDLKNLIGLLFPAIQITFIALMYQSGINPHSFKMIMSFCLASESRSCISFVTWDAVTRFFSVSHIPKTTGRCIWAGNIEITRSALDTSPDKSASLYMSNSIALPAGWPFIFSVHSELKHQQQWVSSHPLYVPADSWLNTTRTSGSDQKTLRIHQYLVRRRYISHSNFPLVS